MTKVTIHKVRKYIRFSQLNVDECIHNSEMFVLVSLHDSIINIGYTSLYYGEGSEGVNHPAEDSWGGGCQPKRHPLVLEYSIESQNADIYLVLSTKGTSQ